MIRRLITRPPRAILLLALAVIAMPNPGAHAQDRAMQERLERLERDLSMLQRQVYRGGASSGGSTAAVDAELRMDRLEAQMRELTGRVEDAANGVEQLRRRLEQINSDVDLRIGQGQVVVPKPAVTSVAGAGIRRETDKTWRDYLTSVLTFYYENGTTEDFYRAYLATRGLDPAAIPGITKESLERA